LPLHAYRSNTRNTSSVLTSWDRPTHIPADKAVGRGRGRLREVTRYRRQLTEERARETQRLQKVLEDANVKLSSVASEVLGVTG
jgi:hypothetical protein